MIILHRWTKSEENVLRKNPKKTAKELSKILNRSDRAIRGRRMKLGLKKNKPYTIKKLSKINRVYLAGLFDGDGVVGIYRNKQTNSVQIVVGIGSTVKSFIDIIGVITGAPIYTSSNPIYRRGEIHRATIQTKSKVVEFLEQIIPFLILKKKQCEIAIEWCKGNVEDNYAITILKEMKHQRV